MFWLAQGAGVPLGHVLEKSTEAPSGAGWSAVVRPGAAQGGHGAETGLRNRNAASASLGAGLHQHVQ